MAKEKEKEKEKIDYTKRAQSTAAVNYSYGGKDFGWITGKRYGKSIPTFSHDGKSYGQYIKDQVYGGDDSGAGGIARKASRYTTAGILMPGTSAAKLAGWGLAAASVPGVGALGGVVGGLFASRFGYSSSKRRDYERALDDYVRGGVDRGSDINRQVWERVKTGEYSIADFKKLVIDAYNPYAATYTGTGFSSYAGQKEGLGGDFGQGGWDRLSGTWGRFGGWDVQRFMQLQASQEAVNRRKEQKQLAPGLSKQTGMSGSNMGITRTAAKRTLMGQY